MLWCFDTHLLSSADCSWAMHHGMDGANGFCIYRALLATFDEITAFCEMGLMM